MADLAAIAELIARRAPPLGIWRISASFSQEGRYALTGYAKSLCDCLHSHPLLVEGEGLCLTDASTEAIEHLLALRDELDEQRCSCGFNNLGIRQPVGALPLDLSDSPPNQGDALKVAVKDAIKVP